MLLVVTTLLAAAGFGFSPPSGWHQAESPTASYSLYAVPDGASTPCSPTMAAAVLPVQLHVSNRSLASVVRGMQDSLDKAGASPTFHGYQVLEHDGVNVGLVETTVTVRGCTYDQLIYLLPGAVSTAEVVFSAGKQDIAGLRPLAQEAAFRTTGISDSAVGRRLAAGLAFDNSGDRDYALGAITGAALVLAFFVWLSRRNGSRKGRITMR